MYVFVEKESGSRKWEYVYIEWFLVMYRLCIAVFIFVLFYPDILHTRNIIGAIFLFAESVSLQETCDLL